MHYYHQFFNLSYRILGKSSDIKLRTRVSLPRNSMLLIFHGEGNCVIIVLYVLTHSRIKPKKTSLHDCYWETLLEYNNCSMITFKLVFKIEHPWIRWVPSRWMRNKRRTKKRHLKMHRKASGQSNYTDGKRAHPIWHHLIARTILSYLRSTKSRSRSWLIFCFLKRSMQPSPQN